MHAVTASAPGKMILCGEHAVVYNRPAIAIPVHQVQAEVTIRERADGQVWIDAPDIHLSAPLAGLPPDHPLALAVEGAQQTSQIDTLPGMEIFIHSNIPIAAGLGSGAAVSVALARAWGMFFDAPLGAERVNALAYRVEQRLHGTPSGIDNTVITYGVPVYFQRGRPFELLSAASSLAFVIADTGIKSPTSVAVADVRRARQLEPQRYERLFDEVGEIVFNARMAIESGNAQALGQLMDQNHTLLQQIGVSCAELDHLVESAREAGALGAKLSGGGRGGNIIALALPGASGQIADRLHASGAVWTLATRLEPVGQE